MSMEINGGYGGTAADYVEQRKYGLRAEQDDEAKQKEEVKKAEDTGKETSGQMSEPRDEYISSEKTSRKSVGLYRVGQDENGNRKIYFDDPGKAARTEGKEAPKAEEDAGAADGREPKTDVCVGNTDRVDGEIRKLKEKKQQLEQQMQPAAGDEKKVRELERKLAQVMQELSRKDNDTYRRQHTVFS